MEANVRNLAEQANGEVFLRYGDTLVMATCVMSKFEKEGHGILPPDGRLRRKILCGRENPRPQIYQKRVSSLGRGDL